MRSVLLAYPLSVLLAANVALASSPARLEALSLTGGALESSLHNLSRRFDVQILFQPSAVRGVQAPSLRGDYTLARALTELLAASPLIFESTAQGVVVKRHKLQPQRFELPEEPRIEEVLVYAYRQSLSSARDQKRDSALITEIVLSQDIADFPNLNLAEALQRVPGVAITRGGGRGASYCPAGPGTALFPGGTQRHGRVGQLRFPHGQPGAENPGPGL